MTPTRDSTVRRDYLATPPAGRGAGVLVVHSGRGLTPFVRRLCHRLARRGYAAHAPDLFAGARPRTRTEAGAVTDALGDEELGGALEDAAVFLRRHDAVSRRRVGVLGLGFGGTWTLRLAAAVPETVAGAVVVSPLPDESWTEVARPVQAHFAERDREVPPSHVRDLAAARRRADLPLELHTYRDVEPSFFEDDETARHDPEAAALARRRTAEFLEATLTGTR